MRLQSNNNSSKMNAGCLTIPLFLAVACIPFQLEAQTTLSGNHIVTGNLNVGTSASRGILAVTGPVGSSANPSLNISGDGPVIMSGDLNSGSSLSDQSKPTLIWIPSKAALRVGEGFNPSVCPIGIESFAVGAFSVASGDYSIALGASEATGNASFAAANGWAWGELCVGLGLGMAEGSGSFAQGMGFAEGDSAVAFSFGYAAGELSWAAIWGTATGKESSAVGSETFSNSFRCVVVGSGNIQQSHNLTTWVPEDPIFIVGNGTGKSTDPINVRQSDALRVLKNGNVIIPKRQGDVLMGEFGNPE